MSRINGDKARFNIRRRKKIAARLRKQEMLKDMATQSKTSETKTAQTKSA